GVMMESLSIVLPAYNEEGVIAKTVASVMENAPHYVKRFEVVVVNDGSHDGTEKIVQNLVARRSEIKLVTHAVNKGYGEALRSGFSNSQMEWILLMDSDGQLDLNELAGFLPYADTFDLIIGFR